MTTRLIARTSRLAVVLVAGALAALSPVTVHAADRAPAVPSTAVGPYPVLSVIDGDTLWLGIGPTRTKVRLIGIDTPETVDPRKPIGCFGPEASARAKDLLTGRQVYLEYDKSQGRRDMYGRTLGYIWLPDGRQFNEEMIATGFGREYTFGRPYAHQQAFRQAQSTARASRAGLWGACPN